MRNTRAIIVVSFFICAIFYLPQHSIAQESLETLKWLKTASIKEKADFWRKAASDLNHVYPMRVDSETVVTHASPVADGIIYHYKLMRVKYEDKSKIEWDVFLNICIVLMKKEYCTNPDLWFFRATNASITYFYNDCNDRYIGKINFIAGSDCEK